MAGSSVVGILKVLLSADSATITSDLARARKAVKETQADFALFGRSGKDAKSVLVDIGDASKREMSKARQATSLLTREFGWLGGHVSKVGSLIGDLASGTLGGFAAATVAAATAVTIAISRITEAWESVAAAEAAALKGVAERRKAAAVSGAERFDVMEGTRLAPLAAADATLDEALKSRARAKRALRDAIVLTSEEHVALFRANEAVEQAMFERTQVYNEAALSQEMAAKRFRESLQEVTAGREAEATLAGLSRHARQAELAIQALGRSFREDLRGVGLSEEAAAKALQIRGADADTIARQVALRKSLEEDLARVLAEQAEHLRRQAKWEDGRPFRERLEAAREGLRLLRQGIDPRSQEARLLQEIAETEERRASATGDERRRLGLQLMNARATLAMERSLTGELERQARARKAAETAVALQRDNDLAALASGPGTDRAKDLARLAVEREDAMRGLDQASQEALDLAREFRRKEAEIHRKSDEAALQARMDFVDRVAAVRRSAMTAMNTSDWNQTQLALDAEVERHSAELRAVNEAQVRGLLTEREAGAKRAAFLASHLDLRLAIQREGRERELAWEVDYRQRLRSLEMEGQTDEAALARLGTEQRVAALQEETRRLVDELRRRGELARATEMENASRAARERIEREGRLREAVAGNDFGAGFRARITQLRDETAAWGRLGAQMADLATQGLSQGVSRALEEITRGTKSAKEAFRDWARDFAFQVASMIQQALILKAILSLFPGLSTAGAGAGGGGGAAPAAPAAAHGGTYRVAGFGGLDSRLVSLRVSPGELVKVTNGANSRGEGGDVHVSLVTRPVVVAEEMAARMSREAKTGLVASALHRGSRRGGRAVE